MRCDIFALCEMAIFAICEMFGVRSKNFAEEKYAYKEKQDMLLMYENALLQTLGFDFAIEHPHVHVAEACKFVKANAEMSATAYSLATASLLLTTMCLQYKPTLVACVCMHLACKWTGWKIEPCSKGKEWYYYIDQTVQPEILETLSLEFIETIEASPEKFTKRYMTAQKRNEKPSDLQSAPSSVPTKRSISLQAYRGRNEKRLKVSHDPRCVEINSPVDPRSQVREPMSLPLPSFYAPNRLYGPIKVRIPLNLISLKVKIPKNLISRLPRKVEAPVSEKSARTL